ncbi:hypothetical protein E2562_024302 [Oryza meyeriana var. granulata]|uniref:R13L1/DRL21-like LRR repeat region domain-containing protein n=1 Tax=Oryza meyeriana var. granulata TaxID=110450 RepID=A0A6G1C9Z6_9ORYZ|nr:hypothetical protein E2562_024302 [Oryza meyeriana var. granulata]
MADPVTIGAAVGWGMKAAGWVVSPIISKLVSKGFSYVGFDAPEKLKQLEIKVLQLELALGLEIAEVHPHMNRLEPLLNNLKSSFYEAEDILDDVEYHRLERQIQSHRFRRNWVCKIQSALPKCSCLKNQEGGNMPSEATTNISRKDEMLEEATGYPCPEFKSRNTLQQKLEEALIGKRFLLRGSQEVIASELRMAGQELFLEILRHVITVASLNFPNIGRLRLLQTLPFLTVKKEVGYELQQLSHLNNLRGKLRIHGLKNVQSKEEALEAKLVDKKRLTELTLAWDDGSCTSSDDEEGVLEGFCPPMQLQKLEIRDYHGSSYPNWMVDKNKNGPNWDTLPDNLEHLTSLKELRISECPNIPPEQTFKEYCGRWMTIGLS